MKIFPKCCVTPSSPTEDKTFETHWGINNFWRDLLAQPTVTLQLLARSAPKGASTPDHASSRAICFAFSGAALLDAKVQEAILALQIERRFTKQQIFTMYCNQIFLGRCRSMALKREPQYYFPNQAGQRPEAGRSRAACGIAKSAGFLLSYQFSRSCSLEAAESGHQQSAGRRKDYGRRSWPGQDHCFAFEHSTRSFPCPIFRGRSAPLSGKKYGTDQVHERRLARLYVS